MSLSIHESFSKRLRRLRKERGLTMKQVAIRLSVPVTTYREWEYGRSIQGTEPYLKLAEVFSVSVLEILGGSKSTESKIWQEVESLEKNLAALKMELRSYVDI